MNFLVIGYGLIGKDRVDALLKLKNEKDYVENIYIHDVIKLENYPKGTIFVDNISDELLKTIHFAIIATPHYVAKEWVKRLGNFRVKILLEKPMGRTLKEAKEIYEGYRYPAELFVGFNYRFYRGIQALKDDILQGRFGRLISINIKLGHGGKPEDKECWKLNAELGASTSLLDPGIHMLDLLNYIFPRRTMVIAGDAWSGFWETGVLEEVHMLLNINSAPVNLQTSIVRWCSILQIEVNGTEGYGIVEGKGRSYGIQSYIRGSRWGWKKGLAQRETEEIVLTTDCGDSFYLELKDIIEDKKQACNASQALEVMHLYDRCLENIK